MMRLVNCALVLHDNGYAKHVIPCEEPPDGLQGNVVMAKVDIDRLSDLILYKEGAVEYIPVPKEEVEITPSETDVLGTELIALKFKSMNQDKFIDALGTELVAAKVEISKMKAGE